MCGFLAFVSIVYYKNPLGILCEKLNDCQIGGQILWIPACVQSWHWLGNAERVKRGLSLASPGRSQDCPKQLSHPVVCPPPASHAFHSTNMHVPPLSNYALCCLLNSQSTSAWWLDVPVFCLSLRQPEKCSMLSYITSSNLYMPSKNILFKCVCPFLTSLRYIHAVRSLTGCSAWWIVGLEKSYVPICSHLCYLKTYVNIVFNTVNSHYID